MMELSGLGLRDGILLTAGLAGVYFVFLMLRLLQVKSRKQHAARRSVAVEPAVNPGGGQGQDIAQDSADVPSAARPVPAPNFGDQLQRFGLESDFLRLQQELAILRGEVSVMRDELERLKAARSVSPLYSEAMNMAERGHDAAGIAGRCGISIAEAELVAALAKNRGEFRDIEEVEDVYDGQGSAGGSRHVA
ncbi:DUF2802 domain-containing protein [Denitratisoma oestradiolicum]|uniref:DUF2802 domain-containing protein n=1 Tax=Denitratisoma oestradiolicum TaxID=311182 RepID=A0A6S6XNV3_9PROT|nr:DUF2802 domain-containing protein [Denitratisoma oestradiolicum]TWO78903.1 hypothetical protein CBW56_17530 [Denitratisoma oestradiolicum]CAB1367526.1 conserved protein of unknown function [Denitratisoma oestradiolicum]